MLESHCNHRWPRLMSWLWCVLQYVIFTSPEVRSSVALMCAVHLFPVLLDPRLLCVSHLYSSFYKLRSDYNSSTNACMYR